MKYAREILIEDFAQRKNKNPNFSLRSYALWLKISPAQLSQILSGKRPVTNKTLKKITDRLDMSPLEKKFLWNAHMKDLQILDSQQEKKVLKIEEDQFRLISDWYHFAILSLTKTKNAKADPRWVAQRLGIKVDEAHQALLRLEKMKILELKPRFRQIGDPLEVISDVNSHAIRQFHKQSLALAIEKIDTVDKTFREFQSMTVPMNPKIIKKIKLMMSELLSDVVEMATEGSATEVYQLNIQLIPVSTIKDASND